MSAGHVPSSGVSSHRTNLLQSTSQPGWPSAAPLSSPRLGARGSVYRRPPPQDTGITRIRRWMRSRRCWPQGWQKD